ncbi:MAG: chromosome segregation protein SMC [Betaproteobacteria bacterium]|nr:chromosome segregation protein SMC [Betaproteobacteria bacterium]
MRLTHIKLAGFKSFVDPTTIPVPGQLVGVVGPNGCGKSNVIDAVRWVLGESSARQLRGESMQDVIFSGSASRKPVARASVELVFDNAAGRAHGQWSQYAEISVKRVLARDGDSSYYINHLQVRRRDVTDIFLGTGLGARAYAIIEQGMISRIIEARPEELRVFLEEAAGISKYKDRRKETEARLSDTREHLERVDDIRQELGAQRARLAAQAQVAEEYHRLQGLLQTHRNLLWLTLRDEASGSRERYAHQAEQMDLELEKRMARVRQIEKDLELAREEQAAAGTRLEDAQGALYGANAEAARLEQELAHLRENRARVAEQMASQKAYYDRQRAQVASSEASLGQALSQLADAQAAIEKTAAAVAAARQALAAAEASAAACRQAAADKERQLSMLKQAREIEDTHIRHADKTLEQIRVREGRLQQEHVSWTPEDESNLKRCQEQLAAAGARLAVLEGSEASHEREEPAREEAVRMAVRALESARREHAEIGARREVLVRLQGELAGASDLGGWLAGHGLEGVRRLWESLEVEPGWEGVVERLLEERVHALALTDFRMAEQWLSGTAPPAPVTAFDAEAANSEPGAPPMEGLRPLIARVACRGQEGFRTVLADWLIGVYTAESVRVAWTVRHALPPGGTIVLPDGHVFTRHSVSLPAAAPAADGFLARSREIEGLEGSLARCEERLPVLREQVQGAERVRDEAKDALGRLRKEAAEARQAQHRLQMDAVKLSQRREHLEARAAAVAGERAELLERMREETEQRQKALANRAGFDTEIEALREAVQDAVDARTEAEKRLTAGRAGAAAAERAAQEAHYAERSAISRIADARNALKGLTESVAELEGRLQALARSQDAFDDEPIRRALGEAVTAREAREQTMRLAREALVSLTERLAALDKERLSIERGLEPLRAKLGEARLKEQEARLNVERIDEALAAAGLTPAEIAELMQRKEKPGALQGEIARLEGALADLGAVNLAALEELKAAEERDRYLESQAADLREAVATLEGAIRRIDRETRERLSHTFEAVNTHMVALFPTLFGGGRAQLVLTGDEILDAGVQVIAQPPGKKNSSIHLLSGGEKALTALSLVFALFQLNPAPFCLLDEVDAPLDDANTERFCELVKTMSAHTQFLFISHNKIAMEMAHQLVGVTMQESGVSRVVAVDVEAALQLTEGLST